MKQSSEYPIHYSRIFAYEFLRTETSIQKDQGSERLISPTGEYLSRVYLCGALTEMSPHRKGCSILRIADPTGVFSVSVNPDSHSLLSPIEKQSLPIFVSVTAILDQEKNRAHNFPVQLSLESLQITERQTRDQWILRTILCTLDRLASQRGSEEKRKELAEYYQICMQAIKQVKPAIPQVQLSEEDRSSLVLALIHDESGPRGVPVDDIVRSGLEKGLSEEQVMTIIRSLIAEDEIYQPSSGYIKIL